MEKSCLRGKEGYPLPPPPTPTPTPSRVSLSENLYGRKVDSFAIENSARACSDYLTVTELPRAGRVKVSGTLSNDDGDGSENITKNEFASF